MKFDRSHHIILVRYRSSGYGVAGILDATTPPEERHRPSTWLAAVAIRNWTFSTVIAGQAVRARTSASRGLRSRSPSAHADFISTTPKGSRSVIILRTADSPG